LLLYAVKTKNPEVSDFSTLETFWKRIVPQPAMRRPTPAATKLAWLQSGHN
jgi:hypothetical protein